jgi:hypothetical protein
VANFVALALLLRVSDETTRARASAPQAQSVGAPL